MGSTLRRRLGDHESSYDGPDSDAEDAEAWDADQREIDEAEMEASYLGSCRERQDSHGILYRPVGIPEALG